MNLIDLLLNTASYLDSHHDAEAVRLRGQLRDHAERLFVRECLPEFAEAVPLADLLPMTMADQRPAPMVRMAELMAKPIPPDREGLCAETFTEPLCCPPVAAASISAADLIAMGRDPKVRSAVNLYGSGRSA